MRVGAASGGPCSWLRCDDSALRSSGKFELNTMMPSMALRLLESFSFTAVVVQVFTDKCIEGVEPNKQRCAELVDKFGDGNSSRACDRL